MARTKVFISYSHNDTDWLERLQTHLKPLEDEGLDRWDDTRILAGDDWREEIGEALKDTQVAILLVSADFLASDFIQNDELPPLLAAAEDAGVRILPIILSPSRFAKTPLGRFQSVNPPSEPLIGMEEVAQEALLVQVADEVEAALRLAAETNDEAGTNAAKKPRNVPARNDYFTGREAILDEVHAALANRGRAMLSGLGGMGKTQIAIEHAHRRRDDYDAALWVTAETETALSSGYARLAQVLGLPQKDEQDQQVIVDAVKRGLETHDGWLLVFDSANDPALLEPYWPQGTTGHRLVTTRARQAQRLGLPAGIPTNRMTPEETLAFLKERTGRGTQTPAEEEAADALARELGCLPLALEQAAAYLVEKQASFANYLTGYRKRGLGLLEKAAPVIGRESVTTTWLLNFEQVEAADEAAADLLRASAFLAPDNIPHELFMVGAAHLGSALAEALTDGEEDALAMDELLEPLTRYSLIRRDVDEGLFHIHGLVQEVVRALMEQDDQMLWEECVMLAMNAAFPGVEFRTWPLCERLLPHARIVAHRIGDEPDEVEAAGRLLRMIGWYLVERARYPEAEPLYRHALNITEKAAGPDHTDTASSLIHLGYLLDHQGRYSEAEPLYRRALEIYERVLGPDHPYTATSLNNLAGLLNSQGHYTEAEPLYRRALEIRERVLGPDHPDTAQSLNNLAGLLKSQGHYTEAEPLYRRALDITERVLGPDHPNTATSLNNLAGLLKSQGHYTEAEPLYRRALDITERVLGPDHPYTATSLNHLAGLLDSQGHYTEAEPLYRRALEIRERVLGPDHPDTAQSLNNLAGLLKSQGHYTEAEPLYRRALDITERVLGPDHPNTATSLNNLAGLLKSQGHYTEAEPLYRRALAIVEQGLGPDHPSTITIRGNLRDFLRKQGREDAAAALGEG